MAKHMAQSKPKQAGVVRRKVGGITRRLGMTKPKGSSR